jgi:hypothetical protein
MVGQDSAVAGLSQRFFVHSARALAGSSASGRNGPFGIPESPMLNRNSFSGQSDVFVHGLDRRTSSDSGISM